MRLNSRTRLPSLRTVLIAALFLLPYIGAAQPPAPAPSARVLPPMPANAEQMARDIGILPLVLRVRAVASTAPPAPGMSNEELSLRQQITEAVLAANLDVDTVISEISYEQAQITDLRGRLSSARANRVNALTVAGIIAGSGAGAIGTGMQLDAAAARPGDWVGIAGGAGGLILSVLALRVKGGSAYLDIAPNMLAPIFGRESEISSVYPPDVWTFLTTVPPANPRVRTPWKEELISEWVRLGRIGPPTEPSSQGKIERLTSGIANRKRLSIDDLTDRGAMLADLRSRVSLMKRDLRDLTKSISIPVL